MHKLAKIAAILGFMSCNIAMAANPLTTGVTDKEVILGNQSHQSGSFAVYGLSARTMSAYFDMINEQGGVHGRKIKFLAGDDAGTAQTALQSAKKQVESDNAFAIVAGQGFQHLGVAKYLREKGVPDLWIQDGSLYNTEPVFKTSFGFTPRQRDEGIFFGKYLLKNFAGKKVGILMPDNANSKESAEALKDTIKDKLKIVIEEVPYSDVNANSQVLKLKNAGVDVVYLLTRMPMTPVILKFAHDQGFKPKWLLSFTNCDNKAIELAGKEASEGVYSWFYTYLDSDTHIPGIKKYLEFMKTRLPNEVPSPISLAGYYNGELTVETLKMAGKDLNRETIVKAAESFKDWKCSVCRSSVTTGPTQHLINMPSAMLVVKDGKWVEVKE